MQLLAGMLVGAASIDCPPSEEALFALRDILLVTSGILLI
jgi:hypothetical protein